MLIFAVVLLFFGAKKLPGLAGSLGKSIREFKKATSGIEEDIKNSLEPSETAQNEKVSSESKKEA